MTQKCSAALQKSRITLLSGTMILCASCATLSAAGRIESQLLDLGLSPARADCLADELSERLDRRDLSAVADFLGGLTEAETPGNAVDALLSIDNPRAAKAVAAAGLSCAFGD